MGTWLKVAAVAIVGATLAGCGENYSEGERHGVVTKFSHKGLAIKSWEGELLMGGMRTDANGAAANVWAFHAPDRLARQIMSAMERGTPVTVRYRQWAVQPIGQDSDYDIVSITTDLPQ